MTKTIEISRAFSCECDWCRRSAKYNIEITSGVLSQTISLKACVNHLQLAVDYAIDTPGRLFSAY